jgi:hypothetical protein
MKIRKYLFLLLPLVLAGCAGLIRTEQPSITDWVPLSAGHPIGQTFVAKYAGLSGIYFYLSPSEIPAAGEIRLHLRSDPTAETDLAVSTNSLVSAQDGAPSYYGFFVPPQTGSNQQYYYAWLEYSGSGSVLIGKSAGDSYLNGALYQDGDPVDAQASFQLSYSRRRAFLGLGLEGLGWIGILAADFFLFILPGWGLFSLLWPSWNKLTWPEKLGLSAGLSLAVYPLLFVWTDVIGLHLGAIYAWLPPLSGLAIIIWRNRSEFRSGIFIRFKKTLLKSADLRTWLPDLALVVIVFLIFFTRLWAIRSLDAPLWADSVQHTAIAQLLKNNGGLFQSWMPITPYSSLTVQFGFSSFSVLFSWLLQLDIPKAVLIVAQLINGLAVITLYPLAVKIARGSHWAGVGAVMAAGLISSMPAYYINWGRFAQLAGQAVLPVALWLIWEALAMPLVKPSLRKITPLTVKTIFLSAIVLAGMMLSYYRMPFFYVTFVLSLVVVLGITVWCGDTKLWIKALIVLIIVAVIAAFLLIPWALRMLNSQLAADIEVGIFGDSPLERVKNEMDVWKNVFRLLPEAGILMALSFVSLVWSSIRKNWNVTAVFLWVIFLIAIIPSMLIHLPGANMMQTFAIEISLYIPLSLVVGWLVAEIALLSKKRLWQVFIEVVVFTVSLYGAFSQRKILHPDIYTYLTRPDLRAMTWIQGNIPTNAVFFVEGVIYNNTSVIGSDAGWWIPILTGRQNTMPPQYAILNENSFEPGYTDRMINLVNSLQKTSLDTPQAFAMLCNNNVTHIYIGQQQGRSALKFLGSPQLFSSSNLVGSTYYDLIYHHDQVYIYAINKGICQ